MPIQQIPPKSAWEKIKADAESVLIDVRTVQEFCDGHPEGALNIPVFIEDDFGQRMPNQDFMIVVQAHVPKEKSVFLSCQSGKRSFMAGMQMERQGYQNLFNVTGGFGGSPECAGWEDEGLPTSTENGADISYESLKTKVKR